MFYSRALQQKVIHGDDEYVDADAHVRELQIAPVTVALAALRRLKGQTDNISQTVPASTTNLPQTGSRSTETDCPSSSLTHQQCTSQERII